MMTIKIMECSRHGNPKGKLADVELHFTDGDLAGLKLIGFGVWERRDGTRNVTFPARQYAVNGERRSFALLRPQSEIRDNARLVALIVDAYAEVEAQADAAGVGAMPLAGEVSR